MVESPALLLITSPQSFEDPNMVATLQRPTIAAQVVHLSTYHKNVKHTHSGVTKRSMALATRELPMPIISRITNLNQAHATLLHAYNKLWRPGPAPAVCETEDDKRKYLAEERKSLREWLERWEQAFTDYLSTAMNSMGVDDLTQCRILKANHLTCTVLASDAGGAPDDFDVFEGEFQAIVDLAGAVLMARQGTNSPQSASTASPIEVMSATSGLDVQAPLYVVLARCRKQAIWDRANRLSLQSRGI